METQLDDTIAAIATPSGQGAIGIVRISGPDAISLANRVTPGVDLQAMASHTARVGTVVDLDGSTVDQCLCLVMHGPNSYTGEDTVELQGHGGAVPLQSVLAAVLSAGARQAEPGEFSQRAFLNGRMDLSQTEAVIDLIQAPAESARDLALRQLEGELAEVVQALRQDVLALAARIEAAADFPEEHDVQALDRREVQKQIDALLARMQPLKERTVEGTIIRQGLMTVIAGKPNVGKSSLFNRMLAQDRAIVTGEAGTTRDTLEEMLNIGGVPVRLLDTAGIRETASEVERLGVERSREALARAGMILFMVDDNTGIQAADQRLAEVIREVSASTAERDELDQGWVMGLINKTDLQQNRVRPEEMMDLLPSDAWVKTVEGPAVYRISVKENQGVNRIRAGLRKRVERVQDAVQQGPVLTRAHQQSALKRAEVAVQQANSAARQGLPLDLITVDLNNARDALGEITGDNVDATLLDQIFDQFCIGK